MRRPGQAPAGATCMIVYVAHVTVRVIFFFFSSRRRHTRFDCDWSSDVCSSDLPDVVRGWTPDGSAVLFSSPRAVFTNRYTQLFTVPRDGGFPTQLPIPNGVEIGRASCRERV